MFPKAIAFCAIDLICSGFVTSNGNTVMLPTLFSSVSVSGLRMVAITFQPLEANNFAVAFPKPVEAPVMKIVFILFFILKLKYKGDLLVSVRSNQTADCCSQNGSC